MTDTLTDFDPAEYLDSEENIREYLADAFETGDMAFIIDAFGVAARAQGMASIARESGVNRESLYRALNSKGNPQFSTILAVAKALGVRLTVSR